MVKDEDKKKSGYEVQNQRTGKSGFVSREFLMEVIQRSIQTNPNFLRFELFKVKDFEIGKWFFGDIDRQIAERHLFERSNILGSFMIRSSKVSHNIVLFS